jgi:hypothetical protein
LRGEDQSDSTHAHRDCHPADPDDHQDPVQDADPVQNPDPWPSHGDQDQDANPVQDADPGSRHANQYQKADEHIAAAYQYFSSANSDHPLL